MRVVKEGKSDPLLRLLKTGNRIFSQRRDFAFCQNYVIPGRRDQDESTLTWKNMSHVHVLHVRVFVFSLSVDFWESETWWKDNKETRKSSEQFVPRDVLCVFWFLAHNPWLTKREVWHPGYRFCRFERESDGVRCPFVLALFLYITQKLHVCLCEGDVVTNEMSACVYMHEVWERKSN